MEEQTIWIFHSSILFNFYPLKMKNWISVISSLKHPYCQTDFIAE